jgi:uncharacterized SAM-binding protein YcdF (DUF218 family)
VLATVWSYETVPTHTTNAARFDTLIVLGCPADPDGKASPEQRERVLEAVREFKAGRAGHMIVTGGAVHNAWNEAATMARVAEAAGVPAADIVVEGRARNTIENVFYSERIMQEQGWTSAEVVSSPSHLPRAALILEHYRFGWRTQAAPWPREYTWWRIAPYYVREAAGTTVLRWFGFGREPFLPEKSHAK